MYRVIVWPEFPSPFLSLRKKNSLFFSTGCIWSIVMKNFPGRCHKYILLFPLDSCSAFCPWIPFHGDFYVQPVPTILKSWEEWQRGKPKKRWIPLQRGRFICISWEHTIFAALIWWFTSYHYGIFCYSWKKKEILLQGMQHFFCLEAISWEKDIIFNIFSA